MADGEIIELEYRMRQQNGEWRWLRSLDTVFERTPDGKPKLLLGTAIDITERKQVVEALECSEKKYRDLVELAGSIILRFDTSGRITFLNEYGQRFFGYSESEIINRDLVNTIVPEIESTGRDLRALIAMLCQDPISHPLPENENILRNGKRVWVQWSNKPIYNDRGELVEILSVGVDVTERKRAQEQLALAKEAAEAASRTKSGFLSMMSHELRTPLTSILGFAEVIAKEASLSAEHQDYLSLIRQSGTHLLNLINSVLEMSRIEAGELHCHSTLFDLHQILKNMEALFSLRASSKGLELIIDWPIDLPQYIHTDEGKLRQVLINLLDNAIKFTPTGRVMLRASYSPDEARVDSALIQIEVEDTGMGIAADEIGCLFDAFIQTESGRSLHQGTGLGLAISRQFVHVMGGNIMVQSQVGQGTCFTVTLPFNVEAQPAPTDSLVLSPAAHLLQDEPLQSSPIQPIDSFSVAASDTLQSLASTAPLTASPSLDDPQTLPTEWRADLHRAALRLSSHQCLTLIEQLPDSHSLLAQTLTQWVDRFQFEELIAWMVGENAD
jgi:PAS domain S-box-containing protein